MAPGSSIKSAWIGSNTATNTISGTSMASPHVAGAAALVLGDNPSFTPQQVRDALVNGATNNTLATLPTGTPNKLLYVGFIGGGVTPPPTDPPTARPVAMISKSCSGFDCTFSGSQSTGEDLSYAWTFSPGGSKEGVGPHTIRYGARQSGTATLVVTNGGGASDPVTVSVTCNPKKCQ